MFSSLSRFDPFNKNSDVRKGLKNVDPTNKNSQIRKELKNIDPLNKNSSVSKHLRNIDPTNKNSHTRKALRKFDKTVVQPTGRFLGDALASLLPGVNSYIAFLEAQAVNKKKRLPKKLINIIDNHYNYNLSKVYYSENINTIHGQAITIGYNIYFPQSINLDDQSHLEWILHELEHVSQYDKHGGIGPFITKYIIQGGIQIGKKGSFDIHDDIQLEKDAINKAKRIGGSVDAEYNKQKPRPKPVIRNNINNCKHNHNHNKKKVKYSKWQYESDDMSWKDYKTSISKQLNAFQLKSNQNNNKNGVKYDNKYTLSINSKYLIDINNYKQQNILTKKERNIRKIAVYYNNKNSKNVKYYKWQYGGKAKGCNYWIDYNISTSKYIEKQYKINNKQFIIKIDGNKQYYINMLSMKQQSLLTNKYRSIKRVPIYKL